MNDFIEIARRLEGRLKIIPSQESCVHSEVPRGRVWCNHYNQSFAGRCNHSCQHYQNKYLPDKK